MSNGNVFALAVTAGIGALVYFKWYRPRRNMKNASGASKLKNFPSRTDTREIETVVPR